MEPENCKHILNSLSGYLDGELEAELCAEIERHLSGCDDCQVVVDSLKKTIYLYHVTAGKEQVPNGLRERLFESLELTDFLKQ
jgi:mycothiol system anti-sigma-R factor